MNRYEALKHAVKAHAGQVDKCGRPYILHPIAVAEAVEPLGDELAIVLALLHDVYEDTEYRLSLSPPPGNAAGALADGLDLLTRRPAQTHAAYVARLCEPAAPWTTPSSVFQTVRIVKLADIWHNLQPERQACLPEKERKGLEKRYLKARDRIWEALGYEWWPSEEKQR